MHLVLPCFHIRDHRLHIHGSICMALASWFPPVCPTTMDDLFISRLIIISWLFILSPRCHYPRSPVAQLQVSTFITLFYHFQQIVRESFWQCLNLHWILHMTNVVLSRPCHLPQFVGRTMAPSLWLLPTSVESFVEPCGRATQLSQYYRFLLTTQLSSCFALYTFKFSWLSWTHVSWHLFICLWPWL